MSVGRDPKTFKEAFAGRRAKLVNKMKTGPDLMNLLEDKEIITSVQRQLVEAISSEHKQVSKLLDALTRCDDKKLPQFLDSLNATNQSHVVDIMLRLEIDDDEFVTRCLSSGTRESTKASREGDQNETIKLIRRKRRSSSSNESPKYRTTLGCIINTRAATAAAEASAVDVAAAADADYDISPKRTSPSSIERAPTVETPRKANSTANVDSSTFSLRDLQGLIGKRQTPQLTAKLVSIGEPKRPHNVRSPATEYFVMYIKEGETRARVVVFDRRHLHEECIALVGKDIVIQAHSYSVHRNRDLAKYPEPIYISLRYAPILHEDPNNKFH